jgi:hypothetical protein
LAVEKNIGAFLALKLPGSELVIAALDRDLAKAAERALALSCEACRRYAQAFSWETATRQFLATSLP